MLLAASDARDVLRLLGVQRTAHAHRQQLGVSADRVQRCPELMAHAGEKLRFRLARSPRFLLRFFPLFNVDCDAEPCVDVSQSIATGPALLQKPAIFPVLSAQSQLDLEVLSLFHTHLYGAADALAVFGMN